MILTILGSGTCIPDKNRNQSGYLVEAGKEIILLDSGSGILRQIAKAGTDFMRINHIFYSHLHPDHTSDMIPILQANYVNTKYLGKKRKELDLHGPEGFCDFYKKIKKLVLPVNEVYKVSAKESRTMKINKIRIISARVVHSENSLAYRMEYKGKSLAYSGDSEYCENLVKLCRNADAAILECSFPYPVRGHMTAEQAGMIAAQANVKTLILTHFYPAFKNYDIKRDVRKHFKGKIILARDLMKVKI